MAKGGGWLPGGTGCYSATLPIPLVQNRDSGCYKVQHRVLQTRLIGQNSEWGIEAFPRTRNPKFPPSPRLTGRGVMGRGRN
jgi:hypothetical protein